MKGGAPASLSSFLGGFVPGNDASDHERESDLIVHLKLLHKTSETTKQKAFDRLLDLVATVPDAALEGATDATIEAVLQHMQYPKPAIRTSSFLLLKALMSRGKEFKKAVVPELRTIAGLWVMGMVDMEASVSQAATAAFEVTFTAEKRPVMLGQYMDDIMGCVTTAVTDIVKSGRPLQDDSLDPRANTLYAALKAMGYLVKQVGVAQAPVLRFVLDSTVFSALLPQRPTPKGYIAEKTPLARSAVLALLRDIVLVCPPVAKLHQMVSAALRGAILDTDVAIAGRTWELLLFWCRGNIADTVGYMTGGFLDDVVNAFMSCENPALAEIIFPCIFPLLTSLSKAALAGDVLDEFCGALVEKLQLLSETANISAHDLNLVLTALMECWELNCVRKKSSGAAVDSCELFTVSLWNVTLLMRAEVKATRYRTVALGAISKSMMKTALRCSDIFEQCLGILSAHSSASFSVLPADASGEVVQAFESLQAGLLGRLAAMVTSADEPNTTDGVESTNKYGKEKNVIYREVNDWLSLKCKKEKLNTLAEFFGESAGTTYCPEDAVAELIIDLLCTVMAKRPTSPSDSSPQWSTEAVNRIVTAALQWDHVPSVQRLIEATSQAPDQSTKEMVLQHMLQDPNKLHEMLLAATRCSAFGDLRQCLTRYETQSEAVLSSSEQQALRKAVSESLQATLNLVVDVDSDDSSSSSAGTKSSSSSKTSTSHRSDDSSSSDDEDAASTSEHSNADSSTKEDAANRAPEVLRRVVEWCDLLMMTSPLSRIMGMTAEVFAEEYLQVFSYITAAVAPRLHEDYYISVKALRKALGANQRREAEDGSDEEEDDLLLYAIEAKTHALGTHHFHYLVEQITGLMDSVSVRSADRDALATKMLAQFTEEDDDFPLPFFCVHQITHLVPYASNDCLQRYSTSARTWRRYTAAHGGRRLLAEEEETSRSLFEGYFPLAELQPRLSTAIRSAQLVRLLDSCGGVDAAATQLSSTDCAALFCEVLRVAATRETMSDGPCLVLFKKVLPGLFACFDGEAVGAEVAQQLSNAHPESLYLVPTLAAVIRDISTREDMTYLRRSMRIVSSITSEAVGALFASSGARGISAAVASLYTTFYRLLDEAADALKLNIASQLPMDQERLLLEASCQLPTWDVITAKLTLVVLRHLASIPAVAGSTVKSLMSYATTQTPFNALELLAELSCTRNTDPSIYSDLIRAIIDLLCRCYKLHHLPSNGRLQSAGENTLVKPAPPSLTSLRRVVMAAVLARRGVVLHSRTDGVLRSTVNLVVFDAVCEAVSRLRSTTDADATPLAKLIAFTSTFMGDLLSSDISVLRASEPSVAMIASVMGFAYSWLYATSVAKVEAMGADTVAGVMKSVCLLSNLTLVRSNTAALRGAMASIMSRCSLRPLREEYSAATPAKIATFRHHNAVLQRTNKQKMLLFPYLLSWCIYLTAAAPLEAEEISSPASSAARSKEWRVQAYGLLDLLLVLMLTPLGKSKRLEDTFLGASLHPPSSDEASLTGQLGFEVVALTRVDAADAMAQLARGAFAVFALLLRGSTLTIVKMWLDTIERKVRALLISSVEQHISPILIQENFLSVLSHSPTGSSKFTVGEGGTVEVNVAKRTIVLGYEIDENTISVSISYPPAFPLRQPVVDYGTTRESGVSQEKWRSWVQKMMVMLFGGSANMWDCIELFYRNLEAHFSGHDPCPICFAVVSAVNHKLPDSRCFVCRNGAFHSNCLYTWWANGGNNVCPLCRSPWIGE